MRRFFLDLSIDKLYIISSLLLVLIIGNWWYFLYNPLLVEFKQTNEEIPLLHAQIARCALVSDQARELEKKYNAAKEEYNTLIDQAHASNPQKAIQSILNYADKAGLSLVSYEMTQSRNDSGKFIATYTLLGSYEALVFFLSNLESAYLMHQITSCTLAQASESTIRCVLKYECSKMDLIS